MTRAAQAAEPPIVVSFFIRRLAGGETFEDAMPDRRCDRQATGKRHDQLPHPTGFEAALTPGDWTARIGGFMPNAVARDTLALCRLGHLEDGAPVEPGGQMASPSRRFAHVNVWGGCCGTESRHIGEIARQVGVVREAPLSL